MKSLVIAIASLIATVSANAQNSTVYYAPVTTNMEVGLGFDRATNQCILSIIEEANEAVDFNFDIINTNGESVLTSELSEGNVNVMPKDRNADYYQCNYELWGTKGKLTCHRAFTAPPGFAPTVTIEHQGDQKTITLPADNHFQNMLTHFHHTVQCGDFEDEYQQILQQANYIGTVRQAALKL